MAESTVIRTKRDGIIAYTDGVNTYTVAYEPGDFKLSVPLETIIHNMDRGRITTVPGIRNGDDQPMTFSHSAYLRDIVSASYATLTDVAVVFASGYVASTWNSTIGTASDAKTWTTNFTVEGSDFGGSDVTLTLPYCAIRGDLAEGDTDMTNISGTSYALRPTFA